MEDGHLYPSDYALKFAQRQDHPAMHKAVAAVRRRHDEILETERK